MVKDWIESQEYDKIIDFLYSPDSKNFVFIAKKDGKTIIVKQDCSWNETKQETPKTIDNKTEKFKYLKQAIVSKSNLIKAKQEKYSTQVDKLVLTLKKEKLQKQLETLQKKDKKTDKEKYLEARVYLELIKR